MSGRPANRRRRLLLWSALPVLLALALAAKLLAAAWFGGQAAAAFARNDAPAAGSAASALAFANILEPHKAPFAAGDALALRGDYAGARTAFEAALDGAPPEDECRVRVNLSLSIERLGDAASAAGAASAGTDGTDDGVRLLEEALAVVRAAPPGCSGVDADRADGGAGDKLQTAGQRLEEKIERLRGQPESVDPGTKPGPEDDGAADPGGSPETQLEQLRESGESAQQERNRGLQREEYLNGSSPGPFTDRPW
ncbi:hypothetical protein [Arthrobacter sp. CG_A4]|uniref:hypothetical protein n=1 Tax=Arthrobacter sp. CG_A4 TaxID=3071706 RepID=UPI002E0AFDA8|nr:tetratricopeptide (TPR) repeat protein [Arthrobacter sp. CG_A4]